MKSAKAVSERFFRTEEQAEKIRSQPQTIYSEVPWFLNNSKVNY